jgi:hypothetical protein
MVANFHGIMGLVVVLLVFSHTFAETRCLMLLIIALWPMYLRLWLCLINLTFTFVRLLA